MTNGMMPDLQGLYNACPSETKSGLDCTVWFSEARPEKPTQPSRQTLPKMLENGHDSVTDVET